MVPPLHQLLTGIKTSTYEGAGSDGAPEGPSWCLDSPSNARAAWPPAGQQGCPGSLSPALPAPSLTTCVTVASLLIQETTSRCKIFLPFFSPAGIFARICTPII